MCIIDSATFWTAIAAIVTLFTAIVAVVVPLWQRSCLIRDQKKISDENVEIRNDEVLSRVKDFIIKLNPLLEQIEPQFTEASKVLNSREEIPISALKTNGKFSDSGLTLTNLNPVNITSYDISQITSSEIRGMVTRICDLTREINFKICELSIPWVEYFVWSNQIKGSSIHSPGLISRGFTPEKIDSVLSSVKELKMKITEFNEVLAL